MEKVFITQNSILHKCKAQCEDEHIGQLCWPIWWTEPNHIFLQNYTNTQKKKKEIHKQKAKQRKQGETEHLAHYISRRRFMEIPKDIGVNSFQTTIFSFLYKTFPHLHYIQIIFFYFLFLSKVVYNIKVFPKKKKWNSKKIMYLRSASGVMYGTREENSLLPINGKSLLVISYTALSQLKT